MSFTRRNTKISYLTSSLEDLIRGEVQVNNEMLGQEAICDVITMVANEKPKSHYRRLWLNRIAPLSTIKTVEETVEQSFETTEVKFAMKQRLIFLARGTSLPNEGAFEADDDPAESDAEGKVVVDISGDWTTSTRISVPVSMNLNDFMEMIASEHFGKVGPHCIHTMLDGGRYFTNDAA